MRDILKNLDQITEAETELKSLAAQIDALADQMSEDEENTNKPRPRDRIEVYGRPRQR